MSEIILLTHTVITILGFGGLIYWMNRQVKALTGAISAQEATIKAQAEQIKSQGEIFKEFESLNNTIRMISDATDSPKMLERWKAYRVLVEEEMQAKLNKHIREVDLDMDRLRDFSKFTGNLFGSFIEAMLYAPVSKRETWINSILVQSAYLTPTDIREMKNTLQKWISVPPLPNHDYTMGTLFPVAFWGLHPEAVDLRLETAAEQDQTTKGAGT